MKIGGVDTGPHIDNGLVGKVEAYIDRGNNQGARKLPTVDKQGRPHKSASLSNIGGNVDITV